MRTSGVRSQGIPMAVPGVSFASPPLGQRPRVGDAPGPPCRRRLNTVRGHKTPGLWPADVPLVAMRSPRFWSGQKRGLKTPTDKYSSPYLRAASRASQGVKIQASLTWPSGPIISASSPTGAPHEATRTSSRGSATDSGDQITPSSSAESGHPTPTRPTGSGRGFLMGPLHVPGKHFEATVTTSSTGS